jgi:hypothetical protein
MNIQMKKHLLKSAKTSQSFSCCFEVFTWNFGGFSTSFYSISDLMISFSSPDNLTKVFDLLRLSSGTFDSIPNFAIIQSAHGSSDMRNLSAQCHLLHGNLEWRWIYLTTLLKLERAKGNGSLRETKFENELKLLMFDLMTLSMSKFSKCNASNLAFSSPFSCICVKEIWFLIQQLILKLGDEINSFWCYFNYIVDQVKDGKSEFLDF